MGESIDSLKYRQETIKITLPVFLELLISSLFGMVDMMMVGNSGIDSITTPSIAAIGITNQMMFIGLAMTQALSTGGTTMIARYVGAKRYDKVPSVLKHILIIAFVLIVIPFEIIGLSLSEEMMRFIGAQQDAISIGLGYFRVVIIGFIFQAFNLTVFASIRGTGDTKTPMKINIFVNMLNVVGNYVLIFGKFGLPALGVTGAGISTSISQVVATVILLYILFKKKNRVYLDFKEKFKIEESTISNLIKIGGPATLEQIAFRVGILFFVKIVSGLGTVVYATHQICLNIMSLSFSPGQAFGIASSTLVGRSLGERNINKAEVFLKESNKLAILVSVVLGFVFFFFGKYITALYTQDQAIISQSIDILKLMAFIQPFQASQLSMAGGLRGAGDTVSTLLVTMFGVVIVRLSVAYLLINVMQVGLMGAWIAMFVDQFVRWVGVTIRYKTGNWKYIKLK